MAANVAKDPAVGSSQPGLREATAPDLLTIVAITIVASVIGDFIHEGAWSRRHVLSRRLAAETLANLIFGTLFWIDARAVRRSAS